MLRSLVRYATAAFYCVGGPWIHLYLITQQRALYAAVDDRASKVYQVIWDTVVLPYLVPWVTVLAIFEVVAGLLMFSRYPRQAYLGQLAGLVFNLALVPFWFSYGIP